MVDSCGHTSLLPRQAATHPANPGGRDANGGAQNCLPLWPGRQHTPRERPADVVTFVGRTRETAEVVAAVSGATSGGGKTALAYAPGTWPRPTSRTGRSSWNPLPGWRLDPVALAPARVQPGNIGPDQAPLRRDPRGASWVTA